MEKERGREGGRETETDTNKALASTLNFLVRYKVVSNILLEKAGRFFFFCKKVRTQEQRKMVSAFWSG